MPKEKHAIFTWHDGEGNRSLCPRFHFWISWDEAFAALYVFIDFLHWTWWRAKISFRVKPRPCGKACMKQLILAELMAGWLLLVTGNKEEEEAWPQSGVAVCSVPSPAYTSCDSSDWGNKPVAVSPPLKERVGTRWSPSSLPAVIFVVFL